MLKRFSISLKKNLLANFDGFIRRCRYSNRSEAVRDLIRKALVQHEWEADKNVIGVITLVYDHHYHQLQEMITQLQHDFHKQITSTTHVHMDHDNCLEVIIVRGKAVEVRELSERLIAIKGVKNGNLAMSSTGKNLH
ncbi:MAG: nickel-responsive transcriptional regulator NikR [Desulfobulbaceae bacterium]|nr:nickel-responsive transcriptional regulator NikR [Desulfobulbaceae bacterium]MCK5323128.1 nickel-responsive transcriptional regulator NikR [Desulfobulbaceae bacterium]MCK5436452.1 nickel-responsive transcriptional regulator NikR [Desulfobulbaceae bacterium]MCK5545032.1 nickel-responsive transcriptional regulator NikR [Desulfobulbaceae bacterium]